MASTGTKVIGFVPQHSGPTFCVFPPEIRLMIYKEYLLSIRLRHGKKNNYQSGGTRYVPRKDSLAILRVCKMMRIEIGDSWLREVLFQFDDPVTMIRKLTALPTATLGQIRHMRVVEGALKPDEFTVMPIHQIMEVLVGLKLDELTVLSQSSPEGLGRHSAYSNIIRMIRWTQGWKTLRYLTQDTLLLGDVDSWYFAEETSKFEDWDIPCLWYELFEEWDEGHGGAFSSLELYQAKNPNQVGAILLPESRNQLPVSFKRTPADEPVAATTDRFREVHGGDKELMLIATRKDGVEYATAAFDPSSWLNKDWVKKGMPIYDPHKYQATLQRDSYDDREEYEWS